MSTPTDSGETVDLYERVREALIHRGAAYDENIDRYAGTLATAVLDVLADQFAECPTEVCAARGRAWERANNENVRLRAAITEAVHHIDANHRLLVKEGYCRICGASDGHWPCIPVEATRDLRAALDVVDSGSTVEGNHG